MSIVGVLLAAATFAFVIGIVLQQHGRTLRRAAAVLFVLALLPSVVFGALRQVGVSFTLDPLGALLGLALLCIGAFAVLQFRRRTPDAPRRVQRRPYTHRGDTDFIEFLRREIDRDA